jgi:hypothetical protein
MVAEQRFRRLNGSELLPDVLAGQKYEDGKPIQVEEKKSVRKGMKRAA